MRFVVYNKESQLRKYLEQKLVILLILADIIHEDYQIIGDEKRYFDDREEARSALSRE